MALWQVEFVLFPKSLLGELDEVPEKTFLDYVEGTGSSPTSFGLPADYHTQFSELLPQGNSWSPHLEIWGKEESDDVQVWREGTGVSLVDVGIRIDVRKLDAFAITGSRSALVLCSGGDEISQGVPHGTSAVQSLHRWPSPRSSSP